MPSFKTSRMWPSKVRASASRRVLALRAGRRPDRHRASEPRHPLLVQKGRLELRGGAAQPSPPRVGVQGFQRLGSQGLDRRILPPILGDPKLAETSGIAKIDDGGTAEKDLNAGPGIGRAPDQPARHAEVDQEGSSVLQVEEEVFSPAADAGHPSPPQARFEDGRVDGAAAGPVGTEPFQGPAVRHDEPGNRFSDDQAQEVPADRFHLG